MTSDLAELAELAAARIRLDERELDLIDRARHDGATWVQIAAALGLRSRQAAEQRRQRLAMARRSRRHERDLDFAAEVAGLRIAVLDLRRWVETDRGWDARFPRAALVRSTAEVALDADPGALYALAEHLAADLAAAGQARLPLPVQRVAERLAALLSTRH